VTSGSRARLAKTPEEFVPFLALNNLSNPSHVDLATSDRLAFTESRGLSLSVDIVGDVSESVSLVRNSRTHTVSK